ncbi:carboxypeptidase-like regulatory domain-containing protein [Aquiflexum sp. TKW24L]|uniref:carboxypeptidase-like regulatory domain-containing protein n=1 Tax=Aquiflexum sp. TKW24L TaxID=2942212 RepID=UPI0020BDC1B5|nr:carboxypeptidase-like regulatory domain-containing protein [Aquiflexum sp. TKW24L]MCL6261459.1 carboxypeptidase-like regulatory domain-containing protein [Aquiflexum sp. TKW24L]
MAAFKYSIFTIRKDLRFVLFLLILLLFSSKSFGQQIPVLEKKVSISAKNEPLETFLRRLSQETGTVFSYSSSAINVDSNVTADFSNKPLREVLETVLEGKVDIKQKGVYVILTPKPDSSKDLVISGYVVDEGTGKPVRDATVYDPITLKSSLTDEFGYFQLSVKNPAEDLKLVINSQSYTDTLLIDEKQSTFQKILLKTKEVDFEEVGKSIAEPIKDFWVWTKKSVAFTNMDNMSDTLHRGFQVSLIPFFGTNKKLSGSVVNDFSFNILGGFSGGTDKLELGGMFNLNRGNVKSVQAAGILNQVSGTVQGLQMAGMFNVVLDSVNAAQVAGLVNFNTGNVKGFQMAGLMNVGTSNFQGFQLAGLANYINRDVDGVQIAGLLNIGRNVKGTQIGLFNYADSIQGVQLGFFNFVRKGYHQVEIGADEMLPLNVSLRSGTRAFYTMLFAGIRTDNADSTTWAFGYGIGTSPSLGKKTHLNIELSTQQMNKGYVSALNLVNRLYIGMEFRLANKIHFYAGPSLNLRVFDSSYDDHPPLFTYTNPNIISESSYPSENIATQLWFGGRAGFRFF